MLRRVSSLAAGRRSKWVILGVWVIIGVALSPLQPKLQEATTNESEAFLPESAESTQVNNLIEERFPEGRQVDGIVVYTRDGRLTVRAQRLAGVVVLGRQARGEAGTGARAALTSRRLKPEPALEPR